MLLGADVVDNIYCVPPCRIAGERRAAAELDLRLRNLATLAVLSETSPTRDERLLPIPVLDALRHDNAVLRSAVDTMGADVTIRDRELALTYQCDRVTQAYGNRLGEKCYRVLWARNEMCLGCPTERAFEDGAPHTSVREIATSSGRPTYLEIAAYPIRSEDGQIRSSLETVRDVTDRVEAEIALRRDKQAAEMANQAKSVFLRTVSHELRTPMNGVLGTAQLLLETPLTAAQRELAETIATSSRNLLVILGDILDLSRLEAGKMTLSSIDFPLGECVAEAIAALAPLARKKGLELCHRAAATVPSRVTGDPTRLRQVLTNLVGNAVKFTRTGQVLVDVATTAGASDGVRVRFAVADTGIGIPAELATTVFDDFTQTNSSGAHELGGTGLGLNISRRLVKLMGGELGFESELGKGSTFWFILPFAVPARQLAPGGYHAADPAQPRAPAATGRSGARVLIVDDDRTNRFLVRAALSRLGYAVDEAADGQVAVDLFAQARYDAVLMDCEMPVMDGYRATAAMRAREGDRRRTPIIALTAHAMIADRDRCLTVGMDDYISKPVEPNRLRDVLERWVQNAGDGAER